MSNKKKVDLISYFLRTSPASRYRQFTKVFTPSLHCSKQPPLIETDEKYLVHFFDGFEVFGISNANITHYKSKKNWEQQPKLRRTFSSMYMAKKTTAGSWQEPKQLIESISLVSTQPGEGTIPLQELEQRLQIASSGAISQVRTKLIYLFKFLINKRDKIAPNSLLLDANIQLCRAIMDALTRTQNGENKDNWRQLEAMEKLLRAREYHKKGLRDIALNNFEQIFRDVAASTKTRLEALKVLCSSGQQLGDPSVLESLASEVQARGEKEYEEIIMISIRRIKETKG